MRDTLFEKQFIAARKNAILSDFSRLNDMQKQAAAATEGPLLILAGAGSGKTTVLIQRTANLLRYGCGSDSDWVPEDVTEEDLRFLQDFAKHPDEAQRERMRELCAVSPVEPWRVMAITFTNKAATELKNRLEAMLGEDARDIWAMTFHSACCRILRRDIERLGYGKDFTIYDTNDTQSTVKRILKELEMDEKNFPPRTVLTYISNAKSEMKGPAEFLASAGLDFRKKRIAQVYEIYEKRLKEANAVDFDDLLLLTVKLLREHEDVREYYARRFRYVLIDEYQDTNRLQYLFAAFVASVHGNICVVGDDDQSIYKFRGATIENILSFEKQYKNARVIRLEQNYRSTGHILAASNAVIRNNTGRKGKELWTEQSMGEKLRLFVSEDEREEAQFVASQILAGYTAGRKWKDHAVLYRMNAQSNQLEYAFKRNGIPYRVYGGMKFFDRAEVKDVLSWLCVVNNPSDTLRLMRVIGAPARGIGQKTVDTAQEIAAQFGLSLFDVFKQANTYPALQRSAAKLGQLVELIEDLRQMAADMPVDQLYDQILDRSGYLRALESKNTDEDRGRIENVNELRTNILSYMEESENSSLAGFLDEVALYTDLESMDSEADCVVLMTMHSAKGLEFPVVFIVGTEEGIFPGIRAATDEEEMEEERRLCYVAMTRAREKLFITCAKRRMLFGKTMPNPQSRFIQEIPDENMDKPAPKYTQRRDDWDEGGSFRSAPTASRSTVTTRRSSYEPPKRYAPTAPSVQSKAAATPAPAAAASASVPGCKAGAKVRHAAFGEGTIVSAKPAGNDTLIVVEFASAGTKRMMLKYAMQHMEILG